MNTKHVELWRRLEQFQMDAPGVALPFSARLARENNWTHAYTQRVIREYKRFAFLAVTAGHPVSPPEDVDQVWHLHLNYSENYWKVFCPEILGRPLHHNPTEGGKKECEKFDDWYGRTLESYRDAFSEHPPGDIWPNAEEKASDKHEFVRVDRQRNWVIPKPRLRLKSLAQAGLGLGGVLALGSVAATNANANVFNWRGPDFLAFFVMLCMASFIVGLVMRWVLRKPIPGEGPGISDLNAY